MVAFPFGDGLAALALLLVGLLASWLVAGGASTRSQAAEALPLTKADRRAGSSYRLGPPPFVGPLPM